mgnify:CR=1 FL=1
MNEPESLSKDQSIIINQYLFVLILLIYYPGIKRETSYSTNGVIDSTN